VEVACRTRTRRERRFRSVINKTDNEIIDKLTLNTSDSLAEYQKVGFQATALPALSFQEETKTFLLFSSGRAGLTYRKISSLRIALSSALSAITGTSARLPLAVNHSSLI